MTKIHTGRHLRIPRRRPGSYSEVTLSLQNYNLFHCITATCNYCWSREWQAVCWGRFKPLPAAAASPRSDAGFCSGQTAVGTRVSLGAAVQWTLHSRSGQQGKETATPSWATPKAIRASHPSRGGKPWLGSLFSSEVRENRFSPPLSIHCLKEGSLTPTQIWLRLRRTEAHKAPKKHLYFRFIRMGLFQVDEIKHVAFV